jgi:hypothetical protein
VIFFRRNPTQHSLCCLVLNISILKNKNKNKQLEMNVPHSLKMRILEDGQQKMLKANDIKKKEFI